MNSPEYIQTSLAAAISLGLEKGSFKDNIKLTGLNLLLTYDGGCIGRCAYCGLSRFPGQDAPPAPGISPGSRGDSPAETKKDCRETYDTDASYAENLFSRNTSLQNQNESNGTAPKNKNTFIRVKWPVYRLDEVIMRTATAENHFQRICISMITHRNAVKDTILITKKIRENINLPISLLISPSVIGNISVIEEFREAGADMIGVAIDAATEEIFKKYRGAGVGGPHTWDKYWKVLKWSVGVFGKFKAGIHLICGLGESGQEMVETIYRAHLMGAKTHLFAFYPEAYSILEGHPRPTLASYRKIQIAAWLINHQNQPLDIIHFDRNGEIAEIDYDLEEVVNEGYAFMTSGCPGKDERIAACNRPLANERPSEVYRNYPYPPTEKDKKNIMDQVKTLWPVKL